MLGVPAEAQRGHGAAVGEGEWWDLNSDLSDPRTHILTITVV